MNVLLFILGAIFFIFCFCFFLKRFYILMAFKHVYIPLYEDEKHLFKNNMPLIIMRNQKRKIRFLIISIIAISLFFNYYTFGIIISSFILSFIVSRLTFNARLYEQNFIEAFKDYLAWFT